ncbi:MAG: class I SAM-dependent methyltransferase, partial [Gemmatimonadales bacterium]
MPTGTVIQTCAGCGLSVRKPLRLGPAAALYDREFYDDYQMVGRDAPPRLVAALPLLERATGPGRLLEIGCGLGAFLVRARERGWEAQGVELSPWAASQARRASEAPVLVAQGEQLPFRAGAFDAVVSHHVFEHLVDPIQALRESRRVCRPGGRLLLFLPNELEHLFVRWALRA